MEKQTIPRIINGPATPSDPAVPKFWNIVEVNDEEAEITMYGEVVSQRPTDWWTGEPDRKSTRLNSSHKILSRMNSSA